jgi:hypothetical protein
MKTQIWTRSNGSKIAIKKMNDYHLTNAVRQTQRRAKILMDEYLSIQDSKLRPLLEEIARRKLKV